MANLDDHYDVDDRFRAFEDHEEGMLVSLAGPGTGKTFNILRRVASLANNQNADIESICYLTFIKEISKAFQSDFENELQHEGIVATPPRISTLHSLACRIIRNRGFSVGYDGELFFSSVAQKPDSFESHVFIQDLIHTLGHPSLNTVARMRSPLLQVKKAWRDTEDPVGLGSLASIAYAGYLELARAYRLIDWDHTIPFALELYQIPANRQAWLRQIKHLLIDEYQDFNKSEQSLISSMASQVTSIVIVGDDDQSIFSGRGGSPEALRSLFQSEDADQISLVRCRRCKSRIVEHANQFLAGMNPNPRLMLPFYDGGLVESFKFKSTKAEIEFLGEFLNDCINKLPDNPRPRDGIICIFPTLKSLRFYFDNLSGLVPSYTNRVEISEARARINYAVSLCVRPHQRFVERLLLEYFEDIKPKHKKKIVDKIMELDTSPTEACQILLTEGAFTENVVPSIESFIAISDSLSSKDVKSIVNYIHDWTEVSSEDLEDLLIILFSSLDDRDQEDAISDFCDAAIPSSALPPESLRSILFLTMHGTKGLTKHTVVMPGLEDAWLPGTASGPKLEERRRLFYVSLTRATDYVLFTYPKNRPPGDPMNFPYPGRSEVSRFVTEAGVITRYHE